MTEEIEDYIVVCVVCGKPAHYGSMKHPYCKEHWESVWDGNYDLYAMWFDLGGHASGMPPEKFKKLIRYKGTQL